MVDKYRNFIDGQWCDAASGETFLNRNPSNIDDVVGEFPASGPEDVDRACQAARAAYKEWRLVPPPKRGAVLLDIYHKMMEHKEQLAQLMSREMGKPIGEARGDVQEGIETAMYMSGEGRRMFGQTSTAEFKGKMAYSLRMPMGVAGLITPWNFPCAIPCWKAFPALICGDAVVIKPASDAPATAVRMAEIFAEAGLPKGLFNVVCGSGGKAGTALAEHPQVNVISFTGSTATGSKLAQITGRDLKRLSLEMGGKNAQIVMDDAKLDLAVEGAVWGAFGTAGQRCTATSRLIVHRKVLDEFTQRLIDGAKRVNIGPGNAESTNVGPLINEAALNKVESYVAIGRDEDHAELILGGKRMTAGDFAKGWFFEPTIFANGKRTMRIAREEIFGPLVLIIPVDSFDEAIDVLNDTDYGLSSSIYTQDVNRAHEAIRDIECGITYINGPTIGAETHMPFGGFKNTGNGHRESGTEVLSTYSEWKTIYVDYSGRLQRAQLDED
ncbi:MAG: aldehyde dehydrogenase family protein [Candidatus Alcyoniella australis]|nr:aldehyde dehydrogenase family protein [Candidatus Alcyoniella australis]